MDKIAVLDCGGQYAHLIANRIRRLGVYSEILDAETKAEKLKDFKGLILSGGPQSVYDEDSVKPDKGFLDLGVPILGICYGHQALAYIQGAVVEPADLREYGLTEIDVLKAAGIFEGLAPKERVWMSHGDSVKTLPEGYEVIGESPGENAAVANFKKNFYGTQFHIEVTHTVHGMKMLENFLKICGVKKEWSIDKFIANEMAFVKEKVGDKKVFMLMSGGVDSTVAYALLARAIGEERVVGLFVDTGFMRKDERRKVEEGLRGAGFKNLHVVDAGAKFFEMLKEKYDPEAKRKIIGDMFLKVQADAVKDLGLNAEEWLLGQGTIYPDTIESGGTKHAAKIKTHHNRVPQIDELIKAGKVIEPLAQLYKDEVRAVGEMLGIDPSLVWRHPFPGPGLAVRCLCAAEEKYPADYRSAEKKINEKLAKNEIEKLPTHSLKARILPFQSVGVQGDFRTYRNPLAIWGETDFVTLEKVATVLINEHKEINRVVYTLAPDKIETLEVRKGYLTTDRIKLLQEADNVVNEFLIENELMRKIWQCPTVLVPVSVNGKNGEALVLRPVESEEAMTANFYKMSLVLTKKLATKLMKIEGITAVFYDVTNKPPGTIEWE